MNSNQIEGHGGIGDGGTTFMEAWGGLMLPTKDDIVSGSGITSDE